MKEVFVCAHKGMLPVAIRNSDTVSSFSFGHGNIRVLRIEPKKISFRLPSMVKKGPFEAQMSYKIALALFTEIKQKKGFDKQKLFFICAQSDPYFTMEYLNKPYIKKMLSFSGIAEYMQKFKPLMNTVSPISRIAFLPMNALAQFLINEKLKNGSACMYGDNSFATAIDDAFWRVSHSDSDSVMIFGANQLFLDCILNLTGGALEHILCENSVTNLLDGAFSFLFTSQPLPVIGPVLRIKKSLFMDFPNCKNGFEAAAKMISPNQKNDYLLIVHNGIDFLKKFKNSFDTMELFGYCFSASAGLNLLIALKRIGKIMQNKTFSDLKNHKIMIVTAGLKSSCHVLEMEL